MTTITQPRRNHAGTVQRVLLACVLLVLGIFAVMYAAGDFIPSLTSGSTAQSGAIECSRIQVRGNDTLSFIDDLGGITSPGQSLAWDNMNTRQREKALQWCRDNNQSVFSDLYR